MGQFTTQLSSYTTEELRGGTKLVPVRVIAATTKPSGIYFEMRLDLSLYDPTQIGPIIDSEGELLEVLGQRQDVAGVEYVQDVNAAGQLIDGVAVTVLSSSGASSETMTYPLDWAGALGAGTVPGGKNPFTGKQGESIPAITAGLDVIENS